MNREFEEGRKKWRRKFRQLVRSGAFDMLRGSVVAIDSFCEKADDGRGYSLTLNLHPRGQGVPLAYVRSGTRAWETREINYIVKDADEILRQDRFMVADPEGHDPVLDDLVEQILHGDFGEKPVGYGTIDDPDFWRLFDEAGPGDVIDSPFGPIMITDSAPIRSEYLSS